VTHIPRLHSARPKAWGLYLSDPDQAPGRGHHLRPDSRGSYIRSLAQAVNSRPAMVAALPGRCPRVPALDVTVPDPATSCLTPPID
jgi:hypothetical protein